MGMRTITVYTCKSERANSKWKSMDKHIFTDERNDARGAKPKRQFTLDDLCDLLDFICRSEYKVVKVTVHDYDGISIFFDMARVDSSFEQIINRLYKYMNALNERNGYTWEYSIAEIHNNPRIRYFINQYYTIVTIN